MALTPGITIAWPWISGSSLVVVLWSALLPRAGGAQQPADEAQRKRLDAQRAQIEAIAPSVLARYNIVKQLRDHVNTARALLTVAEGNLSKYERAYPGRVQFAKDQIARAEADLASAAEQFWGHPTNLDQLVFQTAEARLKQAQEELKVLEEFTHQKELDALGKEVADAKKTLADLLDQLADAEGERAKQDRQGKDDSLQKDLQVLFRLHQAAERQDKGSLGDAQKRLDEATRIWRPEEARRAIYRYDQIRKAIGDAVREILGPPPGP